MAPRALWILNFDAERELSALLDGGSYHNPTPSRAVARAWAAAKRSRAFGLVPETDVAMVPGLDELPALRGVIGRAWCPTPSALAALRRAGAELPAAPPVAVLRRANHRALLHAIGHGVPEARFVTEAAGLQRALDRPSPSGRWLLKSALSCAGGGRLAVSSAVAPDRIARFAEPHLVPERGLSVEPLLPRIADVGVHGFVGRDRTVLLGEPVRAEVDGGGVWSAPATLGEARTPGDGHPAGDLQPAPLVDHARRCGEALADIGYFGPFGLDGFWYRHGSDTAFAAGCDLNARYTLGWALGLGARRPDLEP